jgi:hypothetical protein
MEMKTHNAITKITLFIILFILCSFELWLRDFVAQRFTSPAAKSSARNERRFLLSE